MHKLQKRQRQIYRETAITYHFVRFVRQWKTIVRNTVILIRVKAVQIASYGFLFVPVTQRLLRL